MLNITEVRVKLMKRRSDRLRAFCSITIDDDFVVHDLRVIEGRKGFFVAMPSRKLTDSCPNCGAKNPLRARHCSDCGSQLDPDRAVKGKDARDKLHVDVAHPINTACREALQDAVLEAYRREVEEAGEPVSAAADEADQDLYELGDEYGDYEEEETEEEAEEADAGDEEAAFEPEPAPETLAPEPGPAPEPVAAETEPAPQEQQEEDLLSIPEESWQEPGGEPEPQEEREEEKREAGGFAEGIF